MTRAAFANRVAAYAASPTHREGPTLDLTVDLAGPLRGALALDVSTGPGFTAHALAAAQARTVAADVALPMLRHARGAAPQRLWTAASDTQRLAFADGAFDVVTCRHAFHHYANGPAAAAEMARVLAPGGRLVITDTISPDDPAAAAAMHVIEQTRDPSHVRNWTAAALVQVVERAGLRVERTEHTGTAQEFDAWCARTGVDAAVRAHLWRRFVTDPAPRAAFAARQTGGTRRFVWPVLVVAGVRPA